MIILVNRVSVRLNLLLRCRTSRSQTGGTSEVTVYGTTEGVRTNPQIGLPLQSERINETPILGRKTSALPLLNSAFRSGKGTGDLFRQGILEL